jgi:thiol-disulfide isomerase/thioredoxin
VRARAAAVGVAILVTAPLLAGCGGDPQTKPYTFDPSDSPVDVDTPALRQQTADAGIEPCPTTSAEPSTAARRLPDVTLPCLGGGRDVNIAALRGPLVLNFWAQNCEPCERETPWLQDVADDLRGAVRVIGVDFQDTQPDRALAFADARGVTYPQLADPDGATRAALEIQGLPYTYFVTDTGAIAYVNTGAVESEDDLRGLIAEHLGVPADGGGS